MTPLRYSKADTAGFGLVETLIAVAIIAVMAGLAFESVAINTRTTQAIAERRAAVLIAKSALDLALADDGSATLPATGTTGGLRWRIAVVPYLPRSDTAPAVENVSVDVSRLATGVSIMRLQTLRMGR